MSFSLSSIRLGALLAVVLVAVAAPASARADGHSEKIQFSDPATPVETTNQTTSVSPALSRLNPSQSGLKQVQEDLFRPLANSLGPVDSMEGVMSLPAPRQQRVAPDKHTKEMQERRRNWAFTDLNDLYPEPSVEEMFGVKQYGADGKEKGTDSLIEKYMEGLGQKPAQNRNQSKGDAEETLMQRFSGTNSFNPMTQPFADPEQYLKYKFAPGAKGEESEVAFSSGKGPAATPTLGASEEIIASRKRVEDFKRLLDPSLPASKPVNSLSPVMPDDFRTQMEALGTRAPSLAKTNSGPANMFSPGNMFGAEPARSPLAPLLGIVDPTVAALHSHVNDDPTAYRLGLPNPTPVKTASPPKTAQSIQQMLDPFAASVMKPKF